MGLPSPGFFENMSHSLVVTRQRLAHAISAWVLMPLEKLGRKKLLDGM